MARVKITAETIKEFEALETAFNALHPNLRERIECIEKRANQNVFKLKQQFHNPVKISVASEVSLVTYKGNKLKVECKNTDIFVYEWEINGEFTINVW